MARIRTLRPKPFIDRRCCRCDEPFRTCNPYVRTCRSCRRLEDFQTGEDDYSFSTG